MSKNSHALRSDPIFVVGYKRSGTTVLRLMLNRHPSIFIPEESGYFQRVPRKLRRQIAVPEEVDAIVEQIPIDGYHKKIDWGYFKDLIRCNLPAGPREVLAGIYQACATANGKPGARWGDKKPQHWQFVYKLREWYPHSQFVHIVRDPRDTVASIIQYTQKNDVRLTQHEFVYRIPGLPAHIVLAWHIAYAHRELVQQGTSLGSKRYMSIKYEELVDESHLILPKVCAFLSIDGAEADALVNFQEDATRPDVMGRKDSQSPHMQETKKELNKSRIGRYKSILDVKQVQEIEYVCGKMMKHMGYEEVCDAPLGLHKKLFCSVCYGILSCMWVVVRTVRKAQGSL